MGFKCGIVGLPNVGKSTLFNALTNSSKAQAANFPFCTIDPNVWIVPVIDERLDKLEKISKSKKKIYTTISFVDIGKIKAKFGGSSAGHNGIESIDKFIGKEYSRVRIGIGKPGPKMSTSDYVLNNFNEEEKKELDKITNNIINSISILLDKKLDLFSSTVNNK